MCGVQDKGNWTSVKTSTMHVVATVFILTRLHVHRTAHCALMALRCLALLFAPMKTKKLETNIPYILKILPVSVHVSYSFYVCLCGLYDGILGMGFSFFLDCYKRCLSSNHRCLSSNLGCLSTKTPAVRCLRDIE